MILLLIFPPIYAQLGRIAMTLLALLLIFGSLPVRKALAIAIDILVDPDQTSIGEYERERGRAREREREREREEKTGPGRADEAKSPRRGRAPE